MIICVCKRINSAQIKQALNDGVTEVGELTEQLGLGTGCGRCVEFTKQMIQRETPSLITSDAAA
jgi:bacterioferritin-associated ferredoxin